MTAPVDPDAAEPDDGRSRRRMQNIDEVVEAMLQLLAAGNPWPSAADVARLAGLSERSLYRYFADLDTLARAAVETQARRADHLFQPLPADGTLGQRIDRLVAHRVRMFDEIGPILQAARARATLYEAIAMGLARRREQLRTQLRMLFAEEVGSRGEVLLALEVVTGFDAVHGLRVDRGCSPARTRRILRQLVAALLT